MPQVYRRYMPKEKTFHRFIRVCRLKFIREQNIVKEKTIPLYRLSRAILFPLPYSPNPERCNEWEKIRRPVQYVPRRS